MTGILRAFLSVPAHTAWGMISGIALAERKFLGVERKWYTIVPLPMFLHGSYNFALFSAALICDNDLAVLSTILSIVAFALTILSIGIVYYRSRKFRDFPLVEVRQLQRVKLLPRATCGTCARDCQLCWPCCAEKEKRLGRGMSVSGFQALERRYRRKVERSATDATHAGPAEGAGAPAADTIGPRMMNIIVPDDYVPGTRLSVVGPLDNKTYLVSVPPNVVPGDRLIVPY